MIRLSVNLNKVATVRNSRGGGVPSVLAAADTCMAAGARGLTLHPRADQRHIRPDDVLALAERLSQPDADGVELNIEGDPAPAWIQLVEHTVPDQATLVPVRAGELTSEAGWSGDADVRDTVLRFKQQGIRVSLFIDATPAAVEWAARMDADRVELYTEPYARAHAKGLGEASLAAYVEAATRADGLGLGVNAGHDLDLDNLPLFCRVPHLAEVSIGHALISRALFVGLPQVVREYLDVIGQSVEGR